VDDEGQLDRIVAICAAAEAVDGAQPLDEATWLALRHPERHAIDSTVTDDGFAVVLNGDLSLVVAPDSRVRGVASALLIDVLVQHQSALTAWSHGDHPAAAALARAHGFDRVRNLWLLRRPSSVPLSEVRLPDDVAIRGYRPRDRDDLLRVNAAAFASHPEQRGMDKDDLATRMAEPWFNPADLLLAHDHDGRLLGFHWTKVHSTQSGEIYVLGVAPEAQGRGLGKVLALAGLHHLAARGVPEVHLYVESDNAAALALYAGLDFTHALADTHVMYRRNSESVSQ